MKWIHQKTSLSIIVRDQMLLWKPSISWMIRNRSVKASINLPPARSRLMERWNMLRFFRQKTSHRAWAWEGTTLRIIINHRLCRKNMLKTARTNTTSLQIKFLHWEEVTHLIMISREPNLPLILICSSLALDIKLCNNNLALVQYWKRMRMSSNMLFHWTSSPTHPLGWINHYWSQKELFFKN
jgi:hypothetical protein